MKTKTKNLKTKTMKKKNKIRTESEDVLKERQDKILRTIKMLKSVVKPIVSSAVDAMIIIDRIEKDLIKTFNEGDETK